MSRRFSLSIICLCCFLSLGMPVMAEQATEKLQEREEAATRVLSDFRFKPYGYVKLDAVYDDSRTNYGNYVFFIENQGEDNEFNMTAKQTRIGLNILAPDIYDWKARGRIEVDFYGAAGHENKAEPLLRHAFLESEKEDFTLLAGQTSDLISPLFPNTLNYTVGWAAGNIGYRRPQLRATHRHSFKENSAFISALAIARTTGTTNEDLDKDGQNDGEEAGLPTVQARFALTTELLTDKLTTFGLSGHYGEEKIDWGLIEPYTGDRDREESWSVNGDFDIPLSDRFSVKGEVFVGCNLDDYLGGILQGVNRNTRDSIKTRGGWTQVSYRHSNKWQYKAGLGIDDPENDDLNDGNKSRNSFYYGNVTYNLIPPVTMGLEYSYWETEYLTQRSGTDNRIQYSIIYNW